MNKVGGAEGTYCFGKKGTVGCYGSLECDYSHEFVRCVRKGKSTNSGIRNNKLLNKNITNILNKHRKNKKDLTFKFDKSTLDLIKNDEKIRDIKPLNYATKKIRLGDTIIYTDGKTSVKVKVIDMSFHKSIDNALKKATLKNSFPKTKNMKDAKAILEKKINKNNKSEQFITISIKVVKTI